MTVVAKPSFPADVSDLDEDLVAVPGMGDEVLVVAAMREHLLTICDLFDRLRLSRDGGAAFSKSEAFCGPLHAAVQLPDQDVRASLHEKRDLVDARLVVVGADAPLARSGAPLDVEVETDLALPEDLVGAGPEREQLPDRFHSAAQ